MKKFPLLFVCFLAACSSGNVHLENDWFDPFNKNKDEYFTHGTRFGITNEKENEQETYSLGQNIYTPSTKKPDAPLAVLKKDRPYAGWLYGEYRDTLYNSKNDKTTFGIQLGCLGGSCSLAKEAQQGVHKLIGQGKPAWLSFDELRNEPGIILEAEREKRVYAYNNNADLAVYSLGKLGNIIDSVSLGTTLRVGYNLDTFASSPIIFKVSKDGDNSGKSMLLSYLFFKAEERGVAYNQLLDGSLFQSEPSFIDIHHKPFVNEIDAGLTLGYGKFKFTYTWMRFSSEWKERNAPFAFGGVDFSW